MVMVLIVDLIVLAVAPVIILGFSGEASLNPFIHRRTLQSLLRSLSLGAATQLLIN